MERERVGMYLFDGKEAEGAAEEQEGSGDNENVDILDDDNKIITVGDGSRNIFLGFIRCKLTDQTVRQGCRDLRTQEDP